MATFRLWTIQKSPCDHGHPARPSASLKGASVGLLKGPQKFQIQFLELHGGFSIVDNTELLTRARARGDFCIENRRNQQNGQKPTESIRIHRNQQNPSETNRNHQNPSERAPETDRIYQNPSGPLRFLGGPGQILGVCLQFGGTAAI